MSTFDFLGSFLGKTAQLSKDPHDLSNREAFSIPFGVHVPVKCIYTVPNESYKAEVHGVVQTAPMREDNFAQLSLQQKAVFVPMSSLCRNYLSLTQASRSTRKDEMLNFPIADVRINIRNVVAILFPYYFVHQWLSELKTEFPDLDEVCVKFSLDTTPRIDQTVLEWRQSGVQIPWNKSNSTVFLKWAIDCGIANGLVPGNIAGGRFTLESVMYNIFGKFYSRAKTAFVFDALRLIDNLGYGNYLPIMDHVQSAWIRGAHNYYDNPTTILAEGNFLGMTYSLSDGFRWSVNYTHLISSFKISDNDKNYSAWPLFAYQFYINAYERTNYRYPDSSQLITLDAIFDEIRRLGFVQNDNVTFVSSGSPVLNFGFFGVFSDDNFLDLQRIFNDFTFYNLYGTGSIIFEEFFSADTVSYQSIASFPFIGYLFQLSNPLLNADVFTTSQLSVVSGSVPTVSTANLNANLVKSIADTSALYKLRQDLLRSGVRRDKQMLSIFGVSGNQHVYEPCKILADTSSPIQIQGLLNQAETAEAPLGARGARGNGGIGLKFNLKTEDYGFIFIIQYVTCPTFYESFGVPQYLQYGLHDWWLPQFNHLGLSPIYGSNLSLFTGSSGSDITYRNESVLGFTARNFELKHEVNKVHGLFSNYAFSISSFSGTDEYSLRQATALSRGNGAFGGFIPTVIDQQNSLYNSSESLYYNPLMVNNIFVNMVDLAVFNDLSADPFRCFNVYNIRKVSPMPKLGLYNLNI